MSPIDILYLILPFLFPPIASFLSVWLRSSVPLKSGRVSFSFVSMTMAALGTLGSLAFLIRWLYITITSNTEYRWWFWELSNPVLLAGLVAPIPLLLGSSVGLLNGSVQKLGMTLAVPIWTVSGVVGYNLFVAFMMKPLLKALGLVPIHVTVDFKQFSISLAFLISSTLALSIMKYIADVEKMPSSRAEEQQEEAPEVGEDEGLDSSLPEHAPLMLNYSGDIQEQPSEMLEEEGMSSTSEYITAESSTTSDDDLIQPTRSLPLGQRESILRKIPVNFRLEQASLNVQPKRAHRSSFDYRSFAWGVTLAIFAGISLLLLLLNQLLLMKYHGENMIFKTENIQLLEVYLESGLFLCLPISLAMMLIRLFHISFFAERPRLNSNSTLVRGIFKRPTNRRTYYGYHSIGDENDEMWSYYDRSSYAQYRSFWFSGLWREIRAVLYTSLATAIVIFSCLAIPLALLSKDLLELPSSIYAIVVSMTLSSLWGFLFFKELSPVTRFRFFQRHNRANPLALSVERIRSADYDFTEIDQISIATEFRTGCTKIGISILYFTFLICVGFAIIYLSLFSSKLSE